MEESNKPQLRKCAFCGRTEHEVAFLIPSMDGKAYICDNCIDLCSDFIEQHIESSVLTDIKTLYIDDLCVDENLRRQHIGKELYKAAVSLAKDLGCYNLTLNVWSCNPSAMRFYEAMGLAPQKIGMELIL